MNEKLHINSVLGDLPLIDASVSITDFVLTVYHIFEKDKNTPGIIVLKDENFVGLLSKAKFFETMSKQFMYDLYSKRKIDSFFEEDDRQTNLVLSSSTPIINATNLVLNRTGSEIFDPIIVTIRNNEYRLLDFYQLLLAQNSIQLLMNELLNQANEFKKEVLAITTHDLRNPIGVILGFSDLIHDVEDIATCKEYARNINQSASQMEDLVNSFLTSTINDSIDYKLAFSNFNIHELIQSVITDFELQASKKKQTLILNSSNNLVYITSDRLKIKEVVENLISNAIKYSKEEMKIIVSLKRDENHVRISVEDNGPGFSDTDLKKIFGKFQRLSAKPTGNESSSGLGLYITKTIIEKLNGTINLHSTSCNGSVFIVKIPYQNEDITSKIDPDELMNLSDNQFHHSVL
jgi:signal transduction histidine kinase